jgi:hypothetical protein
MSGGGPILAGVSVIASFYLLPVGEAPTLLEAAGQRPAPVTKQWLGVTFKTGQLRDGYWDFLRARAERLEDLGWSGTVLSTEVMGLLETQGLALMDFADRALSEQLMQERRCCFALLFRQQGAQGLLERIAALAVDEAVVSDYLQGEATYGVEMPPERALLEALSVMERWLAQVDAAHIGLLYIG